MRIAEWAEVAGVAGERTHDALFVRSEERRATGSRRALQDSAPTASVRPGMDRDAELDNRIGVSVFTWQVKGNPPGLRAPISRGPQRLCFLRYLLSSAGSMFTGRQKTRRVNAGLEMESVAEASLRE